MKSAVIFVGLLCLNSCVSEFVPEITEEEELLVVEGIITNQPGPYTIKLSKSLPLGRKSEARPLGGCLVRITDDQGSTFGLQEAETGTYVTDSAAFTGEVGRSYTLEIAANGGNGFHYRSSPMEMMPVPPIDTLYYEKTRIEEEYENFPGIDGCQIYIDTRDPLNACRYYRWDYSETWILRLLFPVENMKCWVSDKSNTINIKSTTALEESALTRYPINFINQTTDRLKIRYSIEVNQYSLNADEYNFWERLQRLTVEVGGLYDIIPSSIPSNMQCEENPNEKVLGYFSVSARSSQRIYIQESFAGIIDDYADCAIDTIFGEQEIPYLNEKFWILIDNPAYIPNPRVRVITDDRGCSDCTLRGTTQKPAFWTGDE